MANFAATDTFSDVVVLETTDQVLGGLPSSPSNKQAQALVNRTEWLKKRIGNREVVVRTLGAMDTLSLSNDIGKLVIVDSNSSYSVRDFPIVIGSSGKVNGNTVTVYFRPNDTTLLIGTTGGGVRYFSGDLVEFIFDGTYFVGNIIHRGLATNLVATTSYISSGGVGIQLPTTSINYRTQLTGIVGLIDEIQLQGGFFPNIGTVISIVNLSGGTIFFRETSGFPAGKISLRNAGVLFEGYSYKRYYLKENEIAQFILTEGNIWELLTSSVSEQPLTGIIQNTVVNLPTSTYPSVKNWINKLIENSEKYSYVFKGDGVGLSSAEITTNWKERCLRFGFLKIQNNCGKYINPLPSSFISYQISPLPTYSVEDYYLKNKEINMFILETGNYTIDIKFTVKNKSISVVDTDFSLMSGQGVLNNYNTETGSSFTTSSVTLQPEGEAEIHLYSVKFPYVFPIDVSGQNAINPYLWVKTNDNFAGNCSYQFSDCKVEIRYEY